MTRRFRLIACTLVGVLLFTSPAAYAQQTVVNQKDLDSAISKSVGMESAQREAITTLLERSDVQALAQGSGLDLKRAETAVGTLKGEELDRLAAMATDAKAQLSAGDLNIRISLIALLLIIIIVILLTK